ncbi:MAG: PTS sugar transporter subunit IIB [Candidatus Njordarchaeia archaeon]
MPKYRYTLNRPLKILTVCGVGMGSSLILKMTAEDALKALNIPAKIEHSVLTEAKAAGADIILAQGLHLDELKDAAPIVLAIKNFVSKKEVGEKIVAALKEKGWLVEE